MTLTIPFRPAIALLSLGLFVAALSACGDDDSTSSTDARVVIPDSGVPDDSSVPEDVDTRTCSHCGDFQTMPGEFDPGNLCEESQPLFNAVAACACGTPDEPQLARCGDVCGDNFCAGSAASTDCANCIGGDLCAPMLFYCFNDD